MVAAPVADLDDAMERLSGVLIDEATVDSVMQLIIALAATITTSDAASISVLTGRGYETMNATDPQVVMLDGVQYETQRGPCVDAIRTGVTIVTNITEDAPAWPEFVAAARDHGVTSVYSSPLEVRGTTNGCLNLYSHRPDAHDEWNHDSVATFARSAAVVLANARAFETTAERNEGLVAALETRELIGEAKGILMHRDGLSSDEAFQHLRTLSQHSNRKLRDVADEIRAQRDRKASDGS
jgi:transcriptional regulator with GAF, ATPase, and Fis domain